MDFSGILTLLNSPTVHHRINRSIGILLQDHDQRGICLRNPNPHTCFQIGSMDHLARGIESSHFVLDERNLKQTLQIFLSIELGIFTNETYYTNTLSSMDFNRINLQHKVIHFLHHKEIFFSTLLNNRC